MYHPDQYILLRGAEELLAKLLEELEADGFSRDELITLDSATAAEAEKMIPPGVHRATLKPAAGKKIMDRYRPEPPKKSRRKK